MRTILHKLIHIIHSAYYWLLFIFVKNNKQFRNDLSQWSEWKQCIYKNSYMQFVFMMTEYKEFRNICYYRMGIVQYLFRWICPPLDSLYINTKDIGNGFLIQHGFATIINAEKIGNNCKIYHQVTVGYNGDKRPMIGDNVIICCGAKVIGGVNIGNNTIIGAQALVIHDVPENAIVGGVPAKVIKYK